MDPILLYFTPILLLAPTGTVAPTVDYCNCASRFVRASVRAFVLEVSTFCTFVLKVSTFCTFVLEVSTFILYVCAFVRIVLDRTFLQKLVHFGDS
jgi:hypothetical protein